MDDASPIEIRVGIETGLVVLGPIGGEAGSSTARPATR